MRSIAAVALSLLVACSPTTSEPVSSTSSTASLDPTTTTTTSFLATSTTSRPTTTTSTPEFVGAITRASEEILGHSWHDGCPVTPNDLDVVTVTYINFDGDPEQGEVIVDRSHSRAVMAVFESLFDNRFPIASIIPIGDLPENAEDDPEYDNTSGFHCRFVDGTTRWSEHAYGRAIDVNPFENPLVADDRIWPEGATDYVDRSVDRPGMIHEGDAVTVAFDSIGWEWGGRWSSLKDYHHFSATGG